MKLRWRIAAGLVAAGALCALLLFRSDNSEQKAVEETRRAMRRDGFKVDLTEFDFSTSDELRARAATLTNATSLTPPRTADDFNRRSALLQGTPDLMAAVGSNATLVVWKQDTLPGRSGEVPWPSLREALAEDRTELDAVCQAVLSGPIRFNLNASAGNNMLLPHLAALKRVAQTLGTRAMLDLHDGNKDAAWTNLLAMIRLATSYDPESVEISHLLRYACAAIVFNATWQTLQTGGWEDDQLLQLQTQWESADFFKGLPETAAFTRASMVATCQLERQQPLSGAGLTLKGMLRSPRYAWSLLTDYWRQRRYRQHGTYEDEKALLLYYRDRELELRRGVQSQTWLEMRSLPGVTSKILFQSKHSSSALSMLTTKQLMLNVHMQGQGLLGRAADAEARRRLLITAIALERYRALRGSYPNTLQELVPELLKITPVDFMDGQPLRYRRTDDGRFVLYSVGLDCTDNGGRMRGTVQRSDPYGEIPLFGTSEGTDLVWPRPASDAEVRAHEEGEQRAREEARQAMQTRVAEEEKETALQRERTLAKLEQLYARKQPRSTKEPTYQGQPLSKVLRNAKASGSVSLTLDELLTLKQITTGKEPDIATFEVPISYDVVTNIGELRLLVDADPDEEDSDGEGGEFQRCERATNGNCLLAWNTTYDPPGKHFLQAHLLCTEKQEDTVEVKGQLAPFVSSNIFQLDPSFGQFGSRGAFFSAKLAESNGLCTIELESPTGEHIRTLTESTSNALIEVEWDMIDKHGKTYTNDSFGCVFHVTLPDSGRSQTLKGP